MGRCCHGSMLNHIDENGTLLCYSAFPLARSSRPARASGPTCTPAKDGDLRSDLCRLRDPGQGWRCMTSR